MARVKATFTIDPATADELARLAERLQQSKSEIVREAIADFASRADRLSERERARLLTAFDELLPLSPPRSAAEVDAEIEAVRSSRRLAGRADERAPSR